METSQVSNGVLSHLTQDWSPVAGCLEYVNEIQVLVS
jgi:hypothetical protein